MISAQDLTNVAAVGGCPTPVLDGVESTHPTFDPSVAESDPFNNFGPAIEGLTKASADKQKFDKIIPDSSIDAQHIILGNVLDGDIKLVEAMTPSGTYANKNPDRPSDGTVIKIKTTPGQVIKAPDSGRKISGSGTRYVGMVMYATADGVRYVNSRNDKPTGNEGYNVYIWNINTDPGVIANYRRGHDEFDRKCFPQFQAGDTLGTAKGDYIYMALRDNGDFVSIRDVSWWNGKVAAGQAATGDSGGTAPTAVPTVSNQDATSLSGTGNAKSIVHKMSPVAGTGANLFDHEVELKFDLPCTGQGSFPNYVTNGVINNACMFIYIAQTGDIKPILSNNAVSVFEAINGSNDIRFIMKYRSTNQLPTSSPITMIFTIPWGQPARQIPATLTINGTYSNVPLSSTATTSPTVAPTGSPTAAPTAVPTIPAPVTTATVVDSATRLIITLPERKEATVCDNSSNEPYCIFVNAFIKYGFDVKGADSSGKIEFMLKQRESSTSSNIVTISYDKISGANLADIKFLIYGDSKVVIKLVK